MNFYTCAIECKPNYAISHWKRTDPLYKSNTICYLSLFTFLATLRIWFCGYNCGAWDLGIQLAIKVLSVSLACPHGSSLMEELKSSSTFLGAMNVAGTATAIDTDWPNTSEQRRIYSTNRTSVVHSPAELKYTATEMGPLHFSLTSEIQCNLSTELCKTNAFQVVQKCCLICALQKKTIS